MRGYKVVWKRALSFGLTKRESEALRLLAEGYTTRGISEEMNINPSTVRGHIGSAARRLAASHRAHLVSRALEEEVVQPRAENGTETGFDAFVMKFGHVSVDIPYEPL
jgi:DNA-binding CsgD family transcriptional regulator